MRYFFYLSFKGTNYHGWQIQPNGNSIQEEIERALQTIFQKKIEIIGAGRTDAGVHAKLMVAHADFDTEIDTNTLLRKINGILPKDIAIHKIISVTPNAHARFSATKRTYEYWITTKKNPFTIESAAQISFSLDIEKMNQASAILLKHTDFTSFSKLHTDVKTNLCTITQAYWEVQGDLLLFRISANRFLRNMVRAIVGTLLEVGKNKLSVADFEKIILEKNRCCAGSSAPAQGLYLTEINYPSEIFLKQ